jgi:hypothetical protein
MKEAPAADLRKYLGIRTVNAAVVVSAG